MNDPARNATLVTPAGQNDAYAMKTCIKTSFAKQESVIKSSITIIP